MSSNEARIKKLEQSLAKPETKNDYWFQFRGMDFPTFWEAIGKPVKNGKEHGYYPYEQEITEALKTHKYVWIKKATGLGITEYFLRYMSWLALRDDTYKGSLFCIVTGPRQDLAEDLMERIQAFFSTPPQHTKTEVYLNGVKIQAFPSNHLDSMRGQPNVKFILLDEADFFRKGEQDNARDVSERYIAKSDPIIAMVSTPNQPKGLYDRMESEGFGIYYPLYLPYTKGLGNIYSEEDIIKAKKSPSFEREYNLKYGYGIGNIWLPEHIDKCIIDDIPQPVRGAPKSIGIDEAFGKVSMFAITLSQLVDGKVQILHAEETESPDPEVISQKIVGLVQDNLFDFQAGDIIRIDASNPAFIKTLKRYFQERTDYHEHMENIERMKGNPARVMRVLPVKFGGDVDRAMLSHARELGNDENLQIPKQFNTLIASMRAAKTEDDGTLDKKENSNDIIDSLFLNLQRYHY